MWSSFFSFGKWMFNSGEKTFSVAEKVYFSATENEKFKRIILASIDFVGTKSVYKNIYSYNIKQYPESTKLKRPI